MISLREKSLALTNYLEVLLDQACQWTDGSDAVSYCIISPRDPSQRGAQLSVRLRPGLLEPVLRRLEENSVVVDERRPDVIRIAPVPLYNTFEDVWQFAQIFKEACSQVLTKEPPVEQAATNLLGVEQKGRATTE